MNLRLGIGRRTMEGNAYRHEIEVYDRLTAVRDALDALLGGHWGLDPVLVATLADLLRSAARHARLADGWPVR